MGDPLDISGKNVMITGASSGIGTEFAGQMAERGAKLVLTARNEGRLQQVAETIKENHGADRIIDVISADLADPATPNMLFQQLQNRGVPIDILVNNAAFGYWGNFEEQSYESLQTMNTLNVVSLASMCHLFIKPMLGRGEGGILNVSSVAGLQPIPSQSDYAATKTFVLNLSVSLWQEYVDRGVAVTVLLPGFTRTGFAKASGMDKVDFEMKFPHLDPDVVAKTGIEGLIKRKPMVIPGKHKNFAQLYLSGFAPMKTKLKMTYKMFWTGLQS